LGFLAGGVPVADPGKGVTFGGIFFNVNQCGAQFLEVD
jgi:hypothetical protein